MNEDNIDEILGITRCVRCGHRLEGEVECPFCSIVLEQSKKQVLPKWVYITAYFLTSPVSLYAIVKTKRSFRVQDASYGSAFISYISNRIIRVAVKARLLSPIQITSIQVIFREFHREELRPLPIQRMVRR